MSHCRHEDRARISEVIGCTIGCCRYSVVERFNVACEIFGAGSNLFGSRGSLATLRSLAGFGG
jgi:hypothetical protein